MVSVESYFGCHQMAPKVYKTTTVYHNTTLEWRQMKMISKFAGKLAPLKNDKLFYQICGRLERFDDSRGRPQLQRRRLRPQADRLHGQPERDHPNTEVRSVDRQPNQGSHPRIFCLQCSGTNTRKLILLLLMALYTCLMHDLNSFI